MTPEERAEKVYYAWTGQSDADMIKAIAAAIREAVSEQEQWLANRLLEWLKTKKPATTAFTEGPLRQVAYAVERNVREAVEEGQMEIWKPIIQGPYLISTQGSLMHSQTGERHNPIPNVYGYIRACMRNWEGVMVYATVHSLVANAFIGSRPEGLTVNHKNGIKTDNRAENLEYMTVQENCQHAIDSGLAPVGEKSHKAKLTEKQVRTILAMHEAKRRHVEIAKEFGVGKSAIDRICSKQSWKSLHRAKEAI